MTRILAALLAYLLLWSSIAEAAYIGTGTSGGLAYFNATGNLTSSSAFTTNVLLKGGGAGNPPSASGITDNGTTVSSSEVLNWSGNATLGGTVTFSTNVTSGTPNGSSCLALNSSSLVVTTACSGGASLVLGTTGISGTGNATNGILYQATGAVLGEIATANNAVLSSSGTGVWSASTTLPSGIAATNMALTTPSLGAATATTINGNTITSGTGTLTIAAGKTLTDTSAVGAVLLLGTTGGGFTGYAGVSGCSAGAFLTALSTAGAGTCTTLTTAMLPTGTSPTYVTVATASPITLAATNQLTSAITTAGGGTINLPTAAQNLRTCVKDSTSAGFAAASWTIKATGTIDGVAGATGFVAGVSKGEWCFASYDGSNWLVE